VTRNTVTSPYLIREILRPLYPFIRSDVQSQMRVAMRIIDRSEHQDQQEFAEFTQNPHIKQRTSLYVQKRLALNPALFQFNRVFQFVSANLLDRRFRRAKWPLETASSRIQESIVESRAKNLTAQLLLNHMFVEANWQVKFPAHRTAPRTFHTFHSQRMKVESMKTLDTFRYYCNYRMQYKLLELPLDTKDQQPLAMWIILPIEGQTFGDMVEKLSWTNIFHASKRLTPKKVCVQLPKFTINYELDTRDVLESLGMEDLFATRALNITVGAQEALGDFIQFAKIEVTENGLIDSNRRSRATPKGKCKIDIFVVVNAKLSSQVP